MRTLQYYLRPCGMLLLGYLVLVQALDPWGIPREFRKGADRTSFAIPLDL